MQKISWVCVSGDVTESNGVLTYTPLQTNPGNPLATPIAGTIKSNCYFSSGKISYQLKLHGTTTYCRLKLGTNENAIYISINEGQKAYSINHWNSLKSLYSPIATAGEKKSLPTQTWISAEIEVDGSNIILRISDVEVARILANIQREAISFDFIGPDKAEVRSVNIKPTRPKIFAVMEFTERFNEIYSDVIIPVSKDFDLDVIRGDDIYNNGLVIQDITKSIIESALIIADITPDNPNVYYEVGYAHASNKPVILLCDNEREKLPFDVTGFRTIFYKNSIAGKSEVESQLRKHLEALLPQN